MDVSATSESRFHCERSVTADAANNSFSLVVLVDVVNVECFLNMFHQGRLVSNSFASKCKNWALLSPLHHLPHALVKEPKKPTTSM